jgi:nicotinamidase/pyrazinamidase
MLQMAGFVKRRSETLTFGRPELRLLKERGIDTVFIGGLATDFCVAWTAVDSCHAGFTTSVVEDACRAIDVNGSLAKAWADMTAAGVKRIQSSDLDV